VKDALFTAAADIRSRSHGLPRTKAFGNSHAQQPVRWDDDGGSWWHLLRAYTCNVESAKNVARTWHTFTRCMLVSLACEGRAVYEGLLQGTVKCDGSTAPLRMSVKRSQRVTRSSTHLTTMHGNTHETTETRLQLVDVQSHTCEA
jgi:hypothetical protein